MPQRHIVITGFMGSGKTTVGTALARLLGCDFVDLDELVTQREQRTPGEIIERDGEDNFRKIETSALLEALRENPATVISLGGGTWTVAGNRRLLAQSGSFTVWLDVPFELCWKRIEASGELRPLAVSHDTAKRRYQERLAVYKLADCRMAATESESAEEIADGIAALILRGRENS